MKLIPVNDYILCEDASDNDVKSCNGFIYKEDQMLKYRIVDMSIKSIVLSDFKIDDVVLVNSIPTKTKISDKTYYLVKTENIIGKI